MFRQHKASLETISEEFHQTKQSKGQAPEPTQHPTQEGWTGQPRPHIRSNDQRQSEKPHKPTFQTALKLKKPGSYIEQRNTPPSKAGQGKQQQYQERTTQPEISIPGRISQNIKDVQQRKTHQTLLCK